MQHQKLSQGGFLWLLQGLCAIHRKPFSTDLAQQQLAPPHTVESLTKAAERYALDASLKKLKASKIAAESFPLVAWLRLLETPSEEDDEASKQFDSNTVEPNTGTNQVTPALILQADGPHILLIEPNDPAPSTLTLDQFNLRYQGYVTRITPKADPANDVDSEAEARQTRKFGFKWFVPELLKHKKLWHEVLLASLVIQLIALATPLFTQAIIDKVVVHRTESTLIVIAIGMLVFMLFSAGLSWVRQYLVLHTGNRVDAVLGASVFERLFKLPPMYFQHRPTGVIAARMQGVSNRAHQVSCLSVSEIRNA